MVYLERASTSIYANVPKYLLALHLHGPRFTTPVLESISLHLMSSNWQIGKFSRIGNWPQVLRQILKNFKKF